MPTGLENELLNDSTVGGSLEEEVSYSGDREYDAGPNTGQYGFVEVEVDGEILECTNAYMSNAYGGQYCVGDTYTDPNGGSQVISSIDPTGLNLAPSQWDAEETYADVGEKLGMSMEEWTDFSAELQALNETVFNLEGAVMGPTQLQIDRLTGRVTQDNPDWSTEEVQAEVNRLLYDAHLTSDTYKEAAAAETALFEKYGIRKENPGTFGSGVWIDGDGKYHKFESSSGNLYQTSQDDGFLDVAVPIGIALGAGIISGGAASAITSGLTAGLSSTAAGAINGVLGSAISQGITTGGIDPSSLLQAAILGGIGGLADGMVNGDWAGTDLDEAIWDMSDMLDMDYDEVVNMLEGVATGAVSGDDLGDIALGVVGNLGQNEIMNWVEEAYGDTINVDDWFKDGASNIPTEALEPIIGGVINAAIEGGMSNEDALKMAWDYFQTGGDVDFALPGEIDLGNSDFLDWLQLPSLDLDIDLPDINLPDINLPEIDLPEIDLPEIDLPEIDLPEVPDVVECMEGWEWSDLYGECVEKIPDDITIEEPEIPDVVECMEGWEWSDLYGECVEKIPDDITIEEPEIPDVVECMEGWEWSDLYGECVEKIPDDITIEEPEVPDLIECMEGWEWSDLYGECIEKLEIEEPPEWEPEFPEIDVPDITTPELPPAPQAQQGDFTPSWSGLFQTGTVDVYKAPPLKSLFKDYL